MKLFLSIFLFAVGFSFSARAETDQLCLRQCVASGLTSTACLKQCSYIKEEASKPPLNEATSTRRVLHTPVPVGKEIVLKKKNREAKPEKDYACFRNCLKSGMAYGLCEASCVKKECQPGDVLCVKNRKQ